MTDDRRPPRVCVCGRYIQAGAMFCRHCEGLLPEHLRRRLYIMAPGEAGIYDRALEALKQAEG